MGIQIISISHRIAPIDVREMFAFTEEQQENIMRTMVSFPEVSECIMLSTCNRTEMYIYATSDSAGNVYRIMENVLLKEAGAENVEEMGDYILFYHGKKAIHHLFQVSAGLDSMVIGEDQILGQVKTAHATAQKLGMTGVYLNTFFRMAVTAAKKVKTDTDLSRTSVSTATLALKIAEEKLGTLTGKKLMIIGATGKIGGIVLMNAISGYDAEIYVTTRSNKIISTKHGNNDFKTIDYEQRYDYLDQMDVVISATSSPHYTLTLGKMKKAIPSIKPRVFVDLAVPMDIDPKIESIDQSLYFNIDDFTRIARENNEKKLMEAELASSILDDYELQFEQWMVFQKSLPIMHEVRDNFMKVTQHKGVEKAFDHLFYWVRENNTPEDLEIFFKCLNH